MQTQYQDQVRSKIDSWQESLNQSTKGYRECPACQEEWNFLRACQYLNDNKKLVTTSVCVHCAETLVSFDLIASRTPLDGVSVEIKWSGEKNMRMKVGDRIETVPRPKNAYAVISYGLTRYIATTNGTGTPIQFKQEGETEPRYTNNAFSLWSMIKNELLHPHPDDSKAEEVIRMTRKASRYGN